jgi:adenosylhomocysteine nucleosidase
MAGVPYRPKVVLSAGFSGALQDGLHVGDIILASEVTSTEGGCWPTTWPRELARGEWQPPLYRGRVLSAPSLIACPEEKRRLGQDRQATAVDMETAALAQMCAARGVPFGCVRVISDDLTTELSPRLVSLLSGARVSPLRSLITLLCSPALVGQFAHLAKRTRFAAERLGKVLGELLTLTVPGSADP